MAHVGQEFALCPAGAFRGGFGAFQLFGGALLLSDFAKSPYAPHALTLDALRLGMTLKDTSVLTLNDVVDLRVGLCVQLPDLGYERLGVAQLGGGKVERGSRIPGSEQCSGDRPHI